MKRHRILTAVLGSALLGLAACATPTVYGPAPAGKGSGYSEYRLEPDRWRVTYRGGSGAPPAQVADYALLRAAELTLDNGYDWFRVTDRFDQQAGGRGGGSSLSIGGGSGSYGRGGGVGVGLGTSFDLPGGPQLSRTIEILMGKGQRPTGLDAYDARDVRRQIGGG